ncbi:MAG: hypothetical protein AAFN81_29725 [Bacteroidota bacterium]
MQEFDLKDIWEGAGDGAAAWYKELRPELVAMARKKNDGVLQRIRRLVFREVLFSLMILGLAIYYLRELEVLLYVLIIVFFLGVIAISYRYYLQFSRQISQVPSLNIVESTEAYLELVGNYKNRMIRLSVALMPVGLIVGFFTGFGVGAENDFSAFQKPMFWVISIAALLIIAGPTYYFTKWYYRFFLGSKEKELEQVLARLREEEEE